MWGEELADNFVVVLLAYLAVGIPLNFYLYHDVVDKRWRSVEEVRTYSARYGALAGISLVLLVLYAYLQFAAEDYKEGGAACLSCAIAVYGLYLRRRQVVILGFFRDHLQRKADSIVAVYKNNEGTGISSATPPRCALLFPDGGYRQGSVGDHLSAVFLDDNYPGEGPRVTWLQRTPMVKDWTEMMVRTGLWVRLAVLPSSLSFDTALRPSSTHRGAVATGGVDKSIAWTLAVVQQQFLASRERERTQEGPDGTLGSLIKCVEGTNSTLAIWRETLSLAPESEWSQALSEFPSAWIEGLEARGVAWEVYLVLALHSTEGVTSTEPQRYPLGEVAPPSLSGSLPPINAGDSDFDHKRHARRLIRATVGEDGFVTPAVLMVGFTQIDGNPWSWLASVQRLSEVWHRVAESFTPEDNPSLDKKLTEGVDLVVALALLLGADKRSFEFSQQVTGQSMSDTLKARHKHVLEQLQGGEAEKVIRASLASWQATQAPEFDSVIAHSCYSLGKILHVQCQYDEALHLYNDAIETWENAGESALLTDVLTSKADMYMQQGYYPRADTLYRQAIAIRLEAPNSERFGRATLYDKLAELTKKQGKYEEADSLYLLALETRGAPERDEEHVTRAATLSKRADLLTAQGKYDAAESLYDQSIDIRVEVLGSDHTDATTLANWAGLCVKQGKFLEASAFFRRSLEIQESALVPEHPALAMTLNNSADLYIRKAMFRKADRLCERSLAMQEKLLGPEHPDVAATLTNRARLMVKEGKFDEAKPFYERSLDIQKEALGSEHPDVGTTLGYMAELQEKEGYFDEASSLGKQSWAILEKALGPEHPDVAMALTNRARLLMNEGKLEEALLLCRQSIGIREKLDPEHPDALLNLSTFAQLCDKEGRSRDAEYALETALRKRKAVLGPDHPDVAMMLNNVADFFIRKGKLVEAKFLCTEAFSIQEKSLRLGHPDAATTNMIWASFLVKDGRHKEAMSNLEQALAIRRQALRHNHPDTVSTENAIALLRKQEGQEG